jgi:selenide,water dikinase
LPATANDRVLVGYGTSDDAGVFLLRDDLAIVQTVDFFTPIVDDPFDFGRIAATNALSDLYAMGATPVSALNIAAFPEDLDLAILERILEGGATVAQQAGVAIIGGHTIKDDEPKYGMAVTGTIDPSRIVRNAGARPGDVLFLTKPLGTGILATALKRGVINEDTMQHAIAWMTTLNDAASRAMLSAGAHAATDITGFGLLGHAREMAVASGVRFHIDAHAVPLLPSALELARDGCVPGGTYDNAKTYAQWTAFADEIDEATRLILCDAQTSGGLLISVASENAGALAAALRAARVPDAIIGRVDEGAGIVVE